MRRDRIRPKESAMTGKYYVAETIRQDGIADRWNGSRSNFSLFEAPCNRTRSILSPPLSLSLSLSLCTSSVVPLAPYATPSFRSNHRIRPGAGCKYLLLQKSWHAGSSKNSKKSASGMHAALFQAQIISDLSRFNPGSRIWATSFHLPVRRLNRIFFYFSFFLFSSSFPRQLWRAKKRSTQYRSIKANK